MPLGLGTALEEMTLVLFTTLAPSGAMACIAVAGVLLFGRMGEAERLRIDRALCIPLVVTMVGLVASATHLGSPANALYVFAGVGRSPLSNEVFAAVLFLAVCGLYWLFCFTERPYVRAQRTWCAFIVFFGAVFVSAIAKAYDAPTVATWSTSFVPANIWLSACAGGPMLALLALRCARAVCVHRWAGKVLPATSALFLIANTACLMLQNEGLTGIWNGYGVASDLVPWYGGMIVAYALAGAASVAVVAWPLRKGDVPSVCRTAIACAIFFSGLFVVRFGFYMMHMTYGLGV